MNKIKVVKCSNGEIYEDLIGEIFNVQEDIGTALSYVISYRGKTRLILAKDCVNWNDYLDDRAPVVYGPESCLGKQLSLFKEEPKERIFESGAKRDSDLLKPYVHNLQGYTRLRFGYLTRLGALKYGDNNFLLGMPTDQALQSLDRHLAKYLTGDRSEDHLSAIIFNAQLVMLNEEKDGITADHYFKQAVNNK